MARRTGEFGELNVDDAVPDGEEHQADPAFKPQFFKQGVAVSVYGPWAQEHFLCDLLVGEFGAHQLQELYLPVIQPKYILY